MFIAVDFCERWLGERAGGCKKLKRHIRTHSYVKTHLKYTHCVISQWTMSFVCQHLSVWAHKYILFAWAKIARQCLHFISTMLPFLFRSFSFSFSAISVPFPTDQMLILAHCLILPYFIVHCIAFCHHHHRQHSAFFSVFKRKIYQAIAVEKWHFLWKKARPNDD